MDVLFHQNSPCSWSLDSEQHFHDLQDIEVTRISDLNHDFGCRYVTKVAACTHYLCAKRQDCSIAGGGKLSGRQTWDQLDPWILEPSGT